MNLQANEIPQTNEIAISGTIGLLEIMQKRPSDLYAVIRSEIAGRIADQIMSKLAPALEEAMHEAFVGAGQDCSDL